VLEKALFVEFLEYPTKEEKLPYCLVQYALFSTKCEFCSGVGDKE